ncbi:MAG: response regulator [Patescibacteria group bacterium]
MDNTKKILLVEDDPFLSSLLKNRLQKEGLEVILAKDGEEGINFLKTTKPNLVLLDIILPKKSGFEVMETLRSDPELQGNSAPVIIISNLGQQEDIAKGRQLGAVEYYIKAKISIDDLVSKVKGFLK